MRNLAIICQTTELVRGLGLFLVWCHRLICIILTLCKHACKDVCDVNPGIEPYPLLARSCDRWWPDLVTFAACKRSIFELKGAKMAQCVSNRCKDLFQRKKDFRFIGHFKIHVYLKRQTAVWGYKFAVLRTNVNRSRLGKILTNRNHPVNVNGIVKITPIFLTQVTFSRNKAP